MPTKARSRTNGGAHHSTHEADDDVTMLPGLDDEEEWMGALDATIKGENEPDPDRTPAARRSGSGGATGGRVRRSAGSAARGKSRGRRSQSTKGGTTRTASRRTASRSGSRTGARGRRRSTSR